MRYLAAPLATLTLLGSLAAQARRPLDKLPASPKPTELPITRVALYKNGVGFFEHAGRVTGDQSVTIDFTSAQLNDVLQSLTAIDLNGGRISGAGYNSTTPLDQQLRTLPLALSADPSDVDFYTAIRGARVQVTGPGLSLTGRLLSIDLRAAAPRKEAEPTPANEERRFLTVVADSGTIRTFELTSTVTVTLLDTTLHTDVTRYLELLASTRNQGLRHLTLLDRGTGPRDLRVSYISEVPVWKSTYRILFTNPRSPDNNRPGAPSHTVPSSEVGGTSTATLQGWSVVDNTTGSDWLNVHLDLIAGAPQSFIQPLSTPYYSRRPEIPLPAEAQLSPQTHESGDVDEALHSPTKMVKEDAAPVAANQTVNVDSAQIAMPMMARSAIGAGSGGNMGGGVRRIGSGSANGVLGGVMGGMGSAPAPIDYAEAAQASITPQTTTAAFDDFFEYTLTDPITIRKNESALVPILQTKLPVERVTLWSLQQPTALRALWITNASTLTLDRGSFSIVENGNFGGEGLLDPIHPGERRLLSYAADQAVRVTVSGRNNTRRVQHLKISKGVLTETSIDIAELTYDIRNAAPEPRTVILEHPVRPGWTLDSEVKPTETTPTTYRFRVLTAPAETIHLHVGERHTNYEYIRLVDRTEDQLILLLRNAHASPATLAALQPVFDAHHAVVALDDQIRAHEAEIGSITTDQNRLRENMKALKGSPEEKALLSRYTGELNAQEDRLSTINRELAQLRTQRTAADQDFQTRLAAIDLDEAL